MSTIPPVPFLHYHARYGTWTMTETDPELAPGDISLRTTVLDNIHTATEIDCRPPAPPWWARPVPLWKVGLYAFVGRAVWDLIGVIA